jgi:hypothetical protein
MTAQASNEAIETASAEIIAAIQDLELNEQMHAMTFAAGFMWADWAAQTGPVTADNVVTMLAKGIAESGATIGRKMLPAMAAELTSH